MKKVFLALVLLSFASSAMANGLVKNEKYWLEWTNYDPGTPSMTVVSGLGSISTQPGVFSINIFAINNNAKGDLLATQKAFCVDLGHYIANPWIATYRQGLSESAPSGMDGVTNRDAAWNHITWIAAQGAGNGTRLQKQGAQMAIWDQMRGDTSAADWNTTGDLTIAGLDTSLVNAASSYITGANNATNWNGSSAYWWEAAPPTVAGSPVSQDLITSVPEPGTILAALSVLGPAAFVFRRKRA